MWSSQTPQLHVSPSYLQQEQPALNPNTTWNCSRSWPHRIEIMLPIVLTDNKDILHRNREWVDVFLRGLLLFWPAVQLSKMTINLVIDEEVRLKTPQLIQTYVHDYVKAGRQQLPQSFPPVHIQYNKYLPRLYETGHDRQQYLMFFADQYTSSLADYVAFFDTDVLVHSYVDREDLFEQVRVFATTRFVIIHLQHIHSMHIVSIRIHSMHSINLTSQHIPCHRTPSQHIPYQRTSPHDTSP